MSVGGWFVEQVYKKTLTKEQVAAVGALWAVYDWCLYMERETSSPHSFRLSGERVLEEVAKVTDCVSSYFLCTNATWRRMADRHELVAARVAEVPPRAPAPVHLGEDRAVMF